MTFTLPRFGRRARPVAPYQTAQYQPDAAVLPAPSAFLQDVLMEVVLPQGQPLPHVSGWSLRLWPYAVLGDATLQAHHDDAGATLSALTEALHAQGVTTLGLARRRAA